MNLKESAELNELNLKKNIYPGRGIVIGMSPNKQYIYQIYWIMGRSENSRNRIFVKDGEFVRNKAFNESLAIDPSLIIYYPIKNLGNIHIVTNGDQTDTIYNMLSEGETFENAIYSREFEPDAPNFTPRISGIADLEGNQRGYKLSIIKSIHNLPEHCCRSFFNYEEAIAGYGHCIHTYESDGSPLPSFKGEPTVVRIFDEADKNLQYYWSLLNNENRISLLVKQINIETKALEIKIINKNITA